MVSHQVSTFKSTIKIVICSLTTIDEDKVAVEMPFLIQKYKGNC